MPDCSRYLFVKFYKEEPLVIKAGQAICNREFLKPFGAPLNFLLETFRITLRLFLQVNYLGERVIAKHRDQQNEDRPKEKDEADN